MSKNGEMPDDGQEEPAEEVKSAEPVAQISGAATCMEQACDQNCNRVAASIDGAGADSASGMMLDAAHERVKPSGRLTIEDDGSRGSSLVQTCVGMTVSDHVGEVIDLT